MIFQRKNSAKLLQVLKEMPKRDGADVFFSFPGSRGAVRACDFSLWVVFCARCRRIFKFIKFHEIPIVTPSSPSPLSIVKISSGSIGSSRRVER